MSRFVAIILVACVLGPAYAESKEASAKDALLEAVMACPLTLGEAISQGYAQERRPVEAEFILDDQDHLLLRATMRMERKPVKGTQSDGKKSRASFETWIGPVHASGWMARAHKVEDPKLVAQAEAQWSLLEGDAKLLGSVLRGAVRTDERAGPSDAVLSVVPILEEGSSHIAMRVGDKGSVRGLHFDLKASTYAHKEPTSSPARVPYDARSLPALNVTEGTWFNADPAPTLKAWRCHPVLVIVTDPG